MKHCDNWSLPQPGVLMLFVTILSKRLAYISNFIRSWNVNCRWFHLNMPISASKVAKCPADNILAVLVNLWRFWHDICSGSNQWLLYRFQYVHMVAQNILSYQVSSYPSTILLFTNLSQISCFIAFLVNPLNPWELLWNLSIWCNPIPTQSPN